MLASGSQQLPPQFTLSSSNILQNSVAKLAQESLREVKRLRILLTRLLTTVETNPDDASDEESDHLIDEMPEGKRTTTAPVSGDVQPDGRLFLSSADSRACSSITSKQLKESLQLHRLVAQISGTLENLDQLATRFHVNRLSSRLGELGLLNALSVLTTVDQLDFASSFSCHLGDHMDSPDPPQPDQELRRSDWLNNRFDAERWSNRYWERTHAILEGLLSCSVFRRSNVSMEIKRQRLEVWTGVSRDARIHLEHLLNDVLSSYPKLTITLMDSGPIVLVVHVKVGEVMQCFITFRRIHPEKIIVRGLTEPMLIKSESTSQTLNNENELRSLSTPLEELLQTKMDLPGPVKDTVIQLLSPDTKTLTSSFDIRGKRSGTGGSGIQRAVLTSPVPIQNLDLVTPSRFFMFQRITSLSQCAVLHFSNDYQPPSAVRGLLNWLHSYHDLFTAPCNRCGQLLGQDVNLPLWRSYAQSRKDDGRAMEAQHEHCQAIS